MEASIIKEKKFYGGSNCEWFATELLCELGIIKYEFDGENQVEILKSIGVDEIKLITEHFVIMNGIYHSILSLFNLKFFRIFVL